MAFFEKLLKFLKSHIDVRIEYYFDEKLTKRRQIFVQTIICNKKLNENYLSATVDLLSLLLLPADLNSLVEKLKSAHVAATFG